MAATPTIPAAPASTPSAPSTPAPASATPTPSTPATPATPATPSTPAPAAATPEEPKSLERQLADSIKTAWEKKAAEQPGQSEVDRQAEAAAAEAAETQPGESVRPENQPDAEQPAAEAAEPEYDEFAPEPAGIGPKDLAAKISANPELKAAIDANPEVRDLIFANSRLAAKAKPFVDMFGSVEEAQAVSQGHQQFATIRNLMGAVKRDDPASTQSVINAMLEADAMRDEEGKPLRDAEGRLVTAGNTGRFLRNAMLMVCMAAENKAKAAGDSEYLAILDAFMERQGLRAPSSAAEEGDEELQAQRAELQQERQRLDEEKSKSQQEAQKAHDNRVYGRIDDSLNKAVDGILDRATGLTDFARKSARKDILDGLKSAVRSNPAYQTELDGIERMPVGEKRANAHVALAQRYIQSLLRKAALPVLQAAGITLAKQQQQKDAAQAARAENARSEVRSSAPPARNTNPGQAETSDQIRERLQRELGREPRLEEILSARMIPAFKRSA